MKDRILEFLRAENKTSSQFSGEIGVQASSVSHIISGRNKPSLDFIIKMLQKYEDLSTDWLLFGTGSMYKDISNAGLSGKEAEIQGGLSFDSSLEHSSANNNEDIESIFPESAANEPLVVDNKDEATIRKVLVFYANDTFKEYKKA